MNRVFLLLLVVQLWVSAARAEESWLPPAIAQSIVEGIATQLSSIDTEGRLSDEQYRASGELLVGNIAIKAERLGMMGLIQLAPDFTRLAMPMSDSEALTAIASYQLCSVPFNAGFSEGRGKAGSYDELAWDVFVAGALNVTSHYLRAGYLADGINDEQAHTFLHGESMQAVKRDVQNQSELFSFTLRKCEGVLKTLFR